MKNELHSVLLKKTKDDLNFLRKYYSVKNASSLNKEKLGLIIAAKMVDSLEEIVAGRLLVSEINLLKILLVSKSPVYFQDDEFVDLAFDIISLGRIGLINEIVEENSYSFAVPEELKKPLGVIINNCKAKKAIKENTTIINVIIALLELYGIVDKEILINEAHRILSVSINVDCSRIMDLLNTYLVRTDDILQYDEKYIYLVEVDNPQYIIDEQNKRETISYKKFGELDLIGINSQTFENLTQDEKSLADYFVKRGKMSRAEASLEIKDITYMIKNGDKLQEIIEFINDFIEFENFEAVQKLSDLVIRLHNSTPSWFLKGHTPLEISRNVEDKLSTKSDSKVIKIRNDKKIGRNEQCPCGSQKKYKNCCGKS